LQRAPLLVLPLQLLLPLPPFRPQFRAATLPLLAHALALRDVDASRRQREKATTGTCNSPDSCCMQRAARQLVVLRRRQRRRLLPLLVRAAPPAPSCPRCNSC
jgi:hypothetical protein